MVQSVYTRAERLRCCMGDASLSRANGQRAEQVMCRPGCQGWPRAGERLEIQSSPLAWCAGCRRELERDGCRVLCQQPSTLQVCEQTRFRKARPKRRAQFACTEEDGRRVLLTHPRARNDKTTRATQKTPRLTSWSALLKNGGGERRQGKPV